MGRWARRAHRPRSWTDVPLVPLRRGISTFGFVDADSDEAKAFTTYLGYWECLARCVTETYGEDFIDPLVADLQSRMAFRKLTSSQFRGDAAELRSLLLNGWNSEVALYLVDDDDDRLMAQNQWNNVYAYYASGRAALAWLLVLTGNAPKSHRRLLDTIADRVTAGSLYPSPWNLSCTAVRPVDTYAGFATPPVATHNLDRSADCFGGVAKMLKTTRARRVRELRDQQLAAQGLSRSPRGFEAKVDAGATATTIFDFMWRSRARANYGDPSMFYVGTLDQWRSRDYVRAVRTSTSATMLLFEALVAQKAKDTLVDAAVHFMSRDRTKITEDVLAPRLRGLGLIR